MRYRERLPAPPLRQLVACYWMFDGHAPGHGHTHRILPDGCADLMIDLSQPAPPRWVGTMTRPLDVPVHGRIACIGVRFRSGGLHALLGAPLSLFVDNDVEIGALPARHWRPPLSALRDTADFETHCARLDASLMAVLPRLPVCAIPIWLAALDHQTELPDVTALADAAGLGIRTLQRRFLDVVGVTPRQHLRWLRFERARRLLEGDTLPLADVAQRSGYADQAHMTRAFVRFAGAPPARFLADRHG